MKQNKQQIEERIKEIQGYLLSHNMADIPMGDFWKLVNELNGLSIIYENIGKSFEKASYLDSYKIIQ